MRLDDMNEFDDSYDDETLTRKYPNQVAVAAKTSELVADSTWILIKNLPPLSSMVALPKTFVEIKRRFFWSKLEMFEKGISVEKQKIDEFFSQISEEEGDYLTEYLTETLYSADEKEKCKIYGYIYSEMVLKIITPTQAKRLFNVIQNSFVEDIEKLDLFNPRRVGDDEVSAALFSAGLLQKLGFDPGEYDEPETPSGTVYSLSDRGRLLQGILEKNKWPNVPY